MLSTYDEYLTSVFPETSAEATERRVADIAEHDARLAVFPHAVVLQVAFPELDFANRWCWQQFGPADGECYEAQSEYPACRLRTEHRHAGTWRTIWLEKTDYDFGFNEWCFADTRNDRSPRLLPRSRPQGLAPQHIHILQRRNRKERRPRRVIAAWEEVHVAERPEKLPGERLAVERGEGVGAWLGAGEFGVAGLSVGGAGGGVEEEAGVDLAVQGEEHGAAGAEEAVQLRQPGALQVER